MYTIQNKLCHIWLHILPNNHFIFFFLLSEFLAEESQEKFWDFVEDNQNIEGEHDGKVNPL